MNNYYIHISTSMGCELSKNRGFLECQVHFKIEIESPLFVLHISYRFVLLQGRGVWSFWYRRENRLERVGKYFSSIVASTKLI